MAVLGFVLGFGGSNIPGPGAIRGIPTPAKANGFLVGESPPSPTPK